MWSATIICKQWCQLDPRRNVPDYNQGRFQTARPVSDTLPSAPSRNATLQWVPRGRAYSVSELVSSSFSQLDRASFFVARRGHQSIRRIRAMLKWLLDDPCAGPLTTLTGKRTPHEFVAWWKNSLLQLKLRESRTNELYLEPHKLIRVGYLISRSATRLQSLDPTRALVGLTMVGFGLMAFRPYRYCICWRRVKPGFDRCEQHSQSKRNTLNDVRSPSETAHASRIARKINQTTERRRQLALTHPAEDRENAISSILWEIPASDRARRSESLQRELENAPRVRSLLPSDFLVLPYAQQLAYLRACLDPNEWAARAWPLQIRLAEMWFSLEAIVTRNPLATGLVPRNLYRLEQAENLLLQGRLHRAVADELGISPSYLSHLLRRGNSRLSKPR